MAILGVCILDITVDGRITLVSVWDCIRKVVISGDVTILEVMCILDIAIDGSNVICGRHSSVVMGGAEGATASKGHHKAFKSWYT